MNNKFEEIEDKAREYGISINDLSYETFHNKFAELIVLECIKVMLATEKEAKLKLTYLGEDVPTSVHEIEIKNYFGIKQ
jgi:hypothetical protein